MLATRVQMELADATKLPIIMLGDANLCAKKWKNSDFLHKAVAEEILSSIAQCGLITHDLGFTYLADRLTPEGEAIQSALDHVYIFTIHYSFKKV